MPRLFVHSAASFAFLSIATSMSWSCSRVMLKSPEGDSTAPNLLRVSFMESLTSSFLTVTPFLSFFVPKRIASAFACACR